MKMNQSLYDEAVLTLENTGSFYRAYLAGTTFGRRRSIISEFMYQVLPRVMCDIEDRDQLRRYFDNRYQIPQKEDNKYAHIPSVWSEPPEPVPVPVPEPKLNPRYLPLVDKIMGLGIGDKWDKQKQPVTYAMFLGCHFGYCLDENDGKTVLAEVNKRRQAASTSSQPAPQENTMTKSNIIEITTKTFLNGVDLATRPDAEIYDAIAQQEADIKTLEAINAKPKRLVAEIEKRKAGIAALVAFLDSKPA